MWANEKMLGVASKLSPEQFTRDLKSSHRSVRDTLAHTLAAEWIWIERWKGTSPKALLTAADFPTVESLSTRWSQVEKDYTEFFNGLTDDSLGDVIAYTNTRGEEWRYPLISMIQHLMNHSTYHRGQVTTMLRQLGADVTPVDLLVFMDAANR
jgi:uncharacterized damage-inducible protein DinB